MWITTSPQLNLPPPTESWMVPHHHLRLRGREVYCGTPQRFRKSIPAPSPPPPIPRRCPPTTTPPSTTNARHQSEPRQVSYLHHTAQAQPIFQEDGDWNVTNPSVLVWICMLIWSNSPSGDSAREQFNHAIYDSCFPAFSVIWEYMHVPPG